MRTKLYNKMCAASDAAKERCDCAVITVAVAAGVSYDEARAMLVACGRESRRSCARFTIDRALNQLGVTLHRVPAATFISCYPKAHRQLQHVTTHHPARFNKVWRDGKIYIFDLKRSHILTVVDGVVHDWSTGRSLRVRSIDEVMR